ncbi:MAG TPA: metallophosphoesterase family protein [Gammaproteobacteria bacterium]|nr:metallophosphoesterase family protein [Gammaproteobacteria bacterium]
MGGAAGPGSAPAFPAAGPAALTAAGPVRLGLIADTHGQLDARVAAALDGLDGIVHAGDVGSGAVIAALQAVAPLTVVRGNNDVPAKWPPADRAQLARLPACAELDLPGGRLVIVHGDTFPAARRHGGLRARWPTARAIVYGHSHRLTLETETLPWIVNPGAAGRARTHGGPSWVLLEAGSGGWRLTPQRFAAATRR